MAPTPEEPDPSLWRVRVTLRSGREHVSVANALSEKELATLRETLTELVRSGDGEGGNIDLETDLGAGHRGWVTIWVTIPLREVESLAVEEYHKAGDT